MKTQTFTLGNYFIDTFSSEEYHTLKREVFTNNIYYFESSNSAPIIIDAGAHIGLSTLYFKKLYPNAKITAIEPLPQNTELLRKNVQQNYLENVDILELALSDNSDPLTLFFDSTSTRWYSTAGIQDGAWNRQQTSESTTVPTINLSSLLQTDVDFLKLDIEGMESKVLFEAGETLKRVKHLIVEFHPTPDQEITTLIPFLQQYFKLTFWKDDQELARPTKTRGLILIEGVARNRN